LVTNQLGGAKIKEILEKIQRTKNGNNHGKYLSRRRTLFYRKKRVDEIKGFYSNLASYVFVNLGLLALNLWTAPNHFGFTGHC
jgi:hypothetical protein